MTAETESPPPTKEKAPLIVAWEIYSPTLIVPFAKLENSNTPSGPFHNIVFDNKIVFLKTLSDFGPQSYPIHPDGILLISNTSLFALFEKEFAP